MYLRRRPAFTALVLLLSLTAPPTAAPLAQETLPTRTRPRRVSEGVVPDAAPTLQERTTGEARAPAEPETTSTERLYVRVGLATDARTVTLAAAGRVIYATANGSEPALIEAARVRVEPRSYAPPQAQTAAAEQAADRAARTNVEAAADRKRPPVGGVRLTSRVSAATRGAAVYAAGETSPRLDARGTLVFDSPDAESDPLRFNDKPYRGSIEVFPNTRGTLTVVNVLSLEDYVRGVVPNELSPGGWPEIEALKAQAVAARTYALGNRGRFGAEGFDLLPTTLSQVYGGRATEHPLTDRAVAETRGVVLTHGGRPINALYTSTCGGRTENAEEIFGGERVAYLRARECAADGRTTLDSFAVRTTREAPPVKSAEHTSSPRDAAILATHGFAIPARLTDEWLSAPLTAEEAGRTFSTIAALARQAPPPASFDSTRPGGFASALAHALDGESRAAALMNRADVAYVLSFGDAADVPERHRADVALFLREGILRLYPDTTLRPGRPLTRAAALRAVARALENRGLLRTHKASARPAANGSLVLRPSGGKGADRIYRVAADAFLFRALGEGVYPARQLYVVGGESVVFHLDAAGSVDYLEVSPAPNGAASDRFSPFASWEQVMSPASLLTRLGPAAAGVGEPLDVRVLRRGESGRVLDLEVVGTKGRARLSGGRIRSALGLREQLFAVGRDFDADGRLARLTFSGRGWGHGVGMCQVGAYGLARAGYKFDQILKAYYTDVALTRLY